MKKEMRVLRCVICRRTLYAEDIIRTGACVCGSNRFSNTRLTPWEHVRMIVKFFVFYRRYARG